MPVCPTCGYETGVADRAICSHHVVNPGDNWADTNRIWCAYFHRGEAIPRLHPEPLTSDVWESYR